MKPTTEEQLRKYYERLSKSKAKAGERERKNIWRRPTLLSSRSQKALLRTVHTETARELKAQEPHEMKVRKISEEEHQRAHESWSIGSFMSWSLFDRMDDEQKRGVIMKLRERRG